MKNVVVLIVVVMFGFSTQSFSKSKEKQSHNEVMKLVDDLREAIRDKEEEKFINLFYTKTIPWISINAKERKGELPSQNGMRIGNHLGFIAWVVSSKEKIEEKFWDINIITDGDIASVYMKYSFHVDNYKSNWGDEALQLVRTGNGWKINSVIYSVISNPEPEKPKN